MIDNTRQKLLLAEEKTKELFREIADGGLIVAGKSERELNEEVVALARREFGIDQFWHKKIVRAGVIRCSLMAAIRPTGISRRTTSSL